MYCCDHSSKTKQMEPETSGTVLYGGCLTRNVIENLPLLPSRGILVMYNNHKRLFKSLSGEDSGFILAVCSQLYKLNMHWVELIFHVHMYMYYNIML